MSRTIIVFFGPPGSGKGTQTNLLNTITRWPAISTGELLRDEVKANSSFAKHIKKYMLRGQMVESSLLEKVLRKRLAKKDAKRGFLLDGYPRNVTQLKHLLGILKSDDKIYFVTINLTDAEVMKRLLSRGRLDDTRKIIKQRLKDYHRWNDPLQKLAKRNGIDIIINGNRSVEVIQKDLRKQLKKHYIL